MNKVKMMTLAFTVSLLASGAEAVGVYHTVNGYIGKAVFQATGACKSRVVYENAQFGTVYNSSDVNIGTGLLSADGQLLSLQAKALKVSYFQASSGMKYSDTYVIDFLSSSTRSLFESNGGCTIEEAFSNTVSKLVYAADSNKNKNKVTMKYSFIGFVPMEVVVKGGDNYGNSKAFTGSISFSGSKL
ncbi:MAG TPA: hypothetical protein VLB90_09265 [Pseudomonadales bacterium]|nr:hypothetical protein [Pseudomonadales bacterium]